MRFREPREREGRSSLLACLLSLPMKMLGIHCENKETTDAGVAQDEEPEFSAQLRVLGDLGAVAQ
jgi:hypothetical protein